MRPDLRDPEQFQKAYSELMPLATSAAERVLHDRGAAEDVAQEVFVALWRRPGAYDSHRGGLPRYVAMLARSRAVDRWRTRTACDAAVERSATQQRALSPSLGEDAADPVIRRETSRSALAALRPLPAEQRAAVLLAFVRGMTAKEIATAESIPLGTVKSRVRLGLQKARVTLDAAA